MPDGTVIRNVPEGTTQSELQSRYGKMVAQSPDMQRAPSHSFMGPPLPTFPDQLTAGLWRPGTELPPQKSIEQREREEVAAIAAEGDRKIPFMQSEEFHEKSIPIAGASLASILVPGSGWGALALQSLMSGAGGTLGELWRQKVTREPTNAPAALKYGAESAAGTAAVGGGLKLAGAYAKSIFSSPLNAQQQQAAQFARDEGVPFPLSSAAPGTGAGRTQQSARALLPGDLRTQVDANRVTKFINDRVGTLTEKAELFDEAALKGQTYLRQVFEPGEQVYQQTFNKLKTTLGEETPIPLTNTREAIVRAAQSLKERGQTGAVAKRLQTMLKADASELTAAQVDNLYSGLLKDAARSGESRPEMSLVVNAIVKDADAVAKDFGMSFADDVASAKKAREALKTLRGIPQLERLSKGFREDGGTLGTKQWMSELFSNPNGKALAELRARNPELYHELADAWLGSNIKKFTVPGEGGIGRVLDGQQFRAWYESNAPALKLIFGGPQAKALDNFSVYAQHMTGAVQRGTQQSKTLEPLALFGRATGELAGIYKQPLLMGAGEMGSYVLAKGLSNPNSDLFRVFTQGFSPATRSFVLKSGEIAGQQAADNRVKDSR
jgi:hypothetical protein